MGLPMSDHMQKQDLLQPCFFEEAAREAALEEERQKEEESQRKLQEGQEMERQLAAKEACLPNEPSLDDENVVTFLVRMPDGSRRGRRFLKSDKLQGGEHDGVLTITINDMGKYGCFPDCSEMMSKPLFAEATINLRRGRLMSSVVAHSLGSTIVSEFIVLFSLDMVLMLFTCKCKSRMLSSLVFSMLPTKLYVQIHLKIRVTSLDVVPVLFCSATILPITASSTFVPAHG